MFKGLGIKDVDKTEQTLEKVLGNSSDKTEKF